MPDRPPVVLKLYNMFLKNNTNSLYQIINLIIYSYLKHAYNMDIHRPFIKVYIQDSGRKRNVDTSKTKEKVYG